MSGFAEVGEANGENIKAVLDAVKSRLEKNGSEL